MTSCDAPVYLLGHSPEELARLERQSRFFDAETSDTLRLAGLAPGMNVLDVGCGAGDVSIAAARIVGTTGRVLGLDTSAEAVALSGQRFVHAGLTWAASRVGDAHRVEEGGFDAVTGRFILMHLADPAALLRSLRTVLRPGGILTFLEMDISSAAITPSLPLFEAGVAAIVAVYRATGSEPDMGSRLFGAYRQAGLSPTLRGTCRVEGGPEAAVYDYLVRSMASLAPAMERHGVAVPHGSVEAYASALRREVEAGDYCVAHPRLTAAWATA